MRCRMSPGQYIEITRGHEGERGWGEVKLMFCEE